MHSATFERVLAASRDFLNSRKAVLYGNLAVRFEVASSYADFDRMLKREMAYLKFDVLERLAEVEVTAGHDAFELKVFHRPLPVPPGAPLKAETLSAFLVRRKYLTYGADRNFQISLPGFAGEVELVEPGTAEFRLVANSLASHRNSVRPAHLSLPMALRAELMEWLRTAMAEWLVGTPEARLLDRPSEILFEAPVPGAWLRISQVDIDSSAEDPHHVFRWQENARAAASRAADLGEAECLAVLPSQGAKAPGESHLVGITRNELPDDAECLTLRYLHRLTDRDADQAGTIVPGLAWRNKGYLDVEGDYWEFHLDGAARTLIGESRKWRPIGGHGRTA